MQQKLTVLVLLCLLFCCSMLIFSGRVLGIDGRAMIATSENFVTQGSWDTNLLSAEFWVSPPPGGQVTWNIETVNAYSKKTPLVAMAHLPLVWLGKVIPNVSWLSIALLTLPIVFVISAIVMVYLARDFGVSHVLATIGVIWWGLGTFVLPYTVEIFAEPIMALGVLLLFWGYITSNLSTMMRALLCGIGAMLVIGGNLASSPITVFALGAFIFYEIVPKRDWKSFLALVLPILFMIGILAYFNVLRSGNPLTSGYFFTDGEGFTTPIIEGLFGLLFSSYRGLIWYAPITILTISGWYMKRHDAVANLMLATIATQIVIYSMWWSWYGGTTWGPRFLIPILPLCVILALPAVRFLWQSGIIGRVILSMLAILSIFIQIPANLVHYSYFDVYLGQQYGANIPNFAYLPMLESPLLINWQYLSPANGWAAWAVDGDWLTGVILGTIALSQTVLLVGVARGQFQRYQRNLAALGVLLAIGSAIIAVTSADRIWKADVTVFQQWLDEQGRPSDVILLNDITHWRFTDLHDRPELYSLPYDVEANDEVASTLVDHMLSDTHRTWYFSPSPNANWVEARIWQTAYVGSLMRVDQYRVLSYQQVTNPMTYATINAEFDSLTLLEYGIQRTEQDIFLSLYWLGNRPADASMFIHLLNSDGIIIDQHDYLPRNGLVPLTDGVYDNHLLTISDAYQNDDLSLRIGWVRSDGDYITPAGVTTDMGFLLMPVMTTE